MIKNIIIFFLMAVVLAFSASATANMTTPVSVSFSDPEDIFQNTSASLTFGITNNGDANLTNISVSTDANSKYSILFNGTSALDLTGLNVNQSATIKVGGYIPNDEPVGNRSIGSVYVRSNQYNASAFYMYADVESKLRISDLDIKVGDKTDSNLQNEGDGYKIDADAEPEDEIEFRIKLKNEYTDEEDVDIENILVRVTIENIDMGDDLEEENNEFDLDPKEDETVTLNFKVPLKVDEEEYDVEILVEAEDKNDIEYRIVKNFVLSVDKKSHEIIIYDAEISPQNYKCSREGTLETELMNIGSANEDEVGLEVKNSALGINIKEKDISLDKNPDDDDNTYTTTIPVSIADDITAGTYGIEIKAYYSEDVLDDYKQVNLVVENCVVATEEEEEETVEVVQEPAEEVTPSVITPTTTEIVPTTTEVSFLDFMESPTYLAVFALGLLVITGAVIALTAKFLLIKKR